MLKYPIGQQDFQYIRENGFIYVDKTPLIFNLVNASKYIFLARPRRFGKSLLISTIGAYFEGKKELFKGLAIESLEKEWTKHPVIALEFSRVNGDSHESLKENLNQQFSLLEKNLGIENKNPDFGSRFSTIIIESYRQSGQRVVILVDEYDNPLLNTLSPHKKDIHEKNRELLKAIYSNLKALDKYIRFGMLTGVSRFSKMTIFSGLNNLFDISFDPRFSSICGITEKELSGNLNTGIIEFANANNMEPKVALHSLKRYYDGYHFSENSEDIYNPFSLLNALATNKISEYWFVTGTPSFLIERLYRENLNLSELFRSEATPATLSSSDASHDSSLALLYQTGYLTIKGYDPEWNLYTLGIPNLEVKSGLLQDMVKIFQDKKNSEVFPTLRNLVRYLDEGNPEEFLLTLKSYMATIPATLTQKTSELYFENNIYIILNLLGIYCRAETVISKGRIDIVIKTKDYIYVIELKLDSPAQTALLQIEEKGYALPFLHEDKTIFKIGVSFSSETRNLSSWQIVQE